MIRTTPRKSESGLTLVEVSVALSLMLIVSAISYELILGVTKASVFAESHNDLTALGQRVVNDVQTDVIQAKLVLQEDSVGTGYRTLFTNALPTGIAPWTGSTMPILDSNTTVIGPDPGPNSITGRTGNSLIVVKQLPPASISYDHDNNNGTANISFMADLYQFNYYFLDQVTQKFGTFTYTVEPIKATSQTVADYFQLSGISVNQSQLVTGLRALSPSVTLAWDPGKAVSAPAFYNLTSGGTITSNSSPTFTLVTEKMIPEFGGGRISAKMTYSVGFNTATPFPVKDTIPLYAAVSSNFPGGLEFMLVGPAGNRKILSRIVLASEFQRKYSSQAAQVITSSHAF